MSETVALTLPESALERIAQRAAEIVVARIDATSAKASNPYLTVAEAAEYLRSKPQRIYDLLSARKLTRYKDGSRTLVARAEIEALVTTPDGPSRVAPALPHISRSRTGNKVAA